VDLYDLAANAANRFAAIPAIKKPADAIMAAMKGPGGAVISETHENGIPFGLEDHDEWKLDRVNGLSIFLPLGEQLQIPVVITETSGITRYLTLLETYNANQLRFVADTGWGELIRSYYREYGETIPIGTTQGPVGIPLEPDTIAPITTISITDKPLISQTITINWSASDPVTDTVDGTSGVRGALLWYRAPQGSWVPREAQEGTSGTFTLTLEHRCANGVAVTTTDRAGNRAVGSDADGNLEPLYQSSNLLIINVPNCLQLPLILQQIVVDRGPATVPTTPTPSAQPGTWYSGARLYRKALRDTSLHPPRHPGRPARHARPGRPKARRVRALPAALLAPRRRRPRAPAALLRKLAGRREHHRAGLRAE
jgi:hypothetical protein